MFTSRTNDVTRHACVHGSAHPEVTSRHHGPTSAMRLSRFRQPLVHLDHHVVPMTTCFHITLVPTPSAIVRRGGRSRAFDVGSTRSKDVAGYGRRLQDTDTNDHDTGRVEAHRPR